MKVNTHNTSMWHYWAYFAKGLATLSYDCFNCNWDLIGVLLAFGRLAKNKLVRARQSCIEFVGAPLMIQIMFVYFGIGLWSTFQHFWQGNCRFLK